LSTLPYDYLRPDWHSKEAARKHCGSYFHDARFVGLPEPVPFFFDITDPLVPPPLTKRKLLVLLLKTPFKSITSMARKASSTNLVNELALINSCPMTYTLSVIGGRWKPVVIFRTSSGITRFSELKRAIPLVTPKMLTTHLRELEKDQIITRKVFAEVPPRVEYALTDRGVMLLPLLKEMNKWGMKQIQGLKLSAP
jgi:DNA-binding HxlR family transcriptional regulator